MSIAITGAPGAGKSTVLRLIREAGETTVSADDVAREVRREPGVGEEMARLLGLPNVEDTAAVRAALWADDAARQKVNALLLPKIAERMRAHPARFHEVPLLVETARYGEYEAVWGVECAEPERLRRLLERWGDPLLVARVNASQLSPKVKRTFADRVCRTDRPFVAVSEEVAGWIAVLKGS